jgi:predicted dehydrogenase
LAREGVKLLTLPASFVAVSVLTSVAVQVEQVRLITLDPGHFHAALVQKTMYPQVSPIVHVYAPEGEDLTAHLKRLTDFNSRDDHPTHWEEQVHAGPDFLERLIREKPGNVVVIAGNNTNKTRYLEQCIGAGLNVLADKPMAINPDGFERLRQTFVEARKRKVLLYDIMTERYEVTTILQRELSRMHDVFGKMETGSADRPAVEMESVHYFFKEVAGKPLIRSGWFFDVRQEGEAIPDVGSHLIDLVQWECFPEQPLDWRSDIRVQSARRWPTALTLAQFRQATGLDHFPDFFKAEITPDGKLNVFGNGEVNYTVRGVHAKVTARWEFEPAPGEKDSHYSLLRGTRASLLILQGPEQKYLPTLYVARESNHPAGAFEKQLNSAVTKLALRYPGIEVRPAGSRWEVFVPERYRVGHEAHFAQVTENFLSYLASGKLPAWEEPNMVSKYFTTTEAFRLSHGGRAR